MGMGTPTIYRYRPAVFPTAFFAGVTASVLQAALIALAPALGLPLIDVARIIGGIFTADPESAEVAGYAIFIANGVLVVPLAFTQWWRYLPGDDVAFRGAIVKGLLLAAAISVMLVVLLPLLALVSKLPGDALTQPDALALGDALVGSAWVLATVVAYSVALALVGAMARGISPADTVGWAWWSHGSGESP